MDMDSFPNFFHMLISDWFMTDGQRTDGLTDRLTENKF